MRYAAQAEAGQGASSMKMARVPVGNGAGNYQGAERTTSLRTTAPIQIFTLGRFNIAIEKKAIHSKGKASHRPIGLLMALIALGGRDVAPSRLCEFLWPDSEGDLAARSLAITLHRLRSLLQTRAAVVCDCGKLSLNEAVCWVDVWGFEHAVNEGLRRIDEPAGCVEGERNLRAALDLYSGHFLEREAEEHWMLMPRLRLKTKFERMVATLSMFLERQDRIADAIDLCLRGIESDPLNESLYRRLMSCYLNKSEMAAVARTYLRCQEAMAKGLGTAPSVETERLYREALRAGATRNDGIARLIRLPANHQSQVQRN